MVILITNNKVTTNTILVFSQKLYKLIAEDFQELVGLPKVVVDKMVQRRQEARENKRGTPCLLSPTDEIVFFLLFLRHHLVDNLLGLLFDISHQTAYNTRKRMTQYMYQEYGSLLTLKDVNWRKENGISIFEQRFTWVADGSEQPVLAPRISSALNTYFFSAKKGRCTINILIVINIQTKQILYLSPSVGGSVNDNELVIKTAKEWHGKFEDDENGLGDKGFNGLDKEGIRITTPTGGPHELINKVISRYRVRVENVIADLKNWHALDYQLRMKTKNREKALAFHNQLWTIGAVFVNEARTGYSNLLK